jgi:hypothetical protein
LKALAKEKKWRSVQLGEEAAKEKMHLKASSAQRKLEK